MGAGGLEREEGGACVPRSSGCPTPTALAPLAWSSCSSTSTGCVGPSGAPTEREEG